MACDLANEIYELAKTNAEREKYEDEQLRCVQIEFIHGFVEGYEVSKVIHLIYDPKKNALVLRYNKTSCSSSCNSFEVLCQLVFFDLLKIHEQQDARGSDAFVPDISYITIRTHFMGSITSQCRYVFKQTLTQDDVLGYSTWYDDERTHELHCFLLKFFEFARSLLPQPTSKRCSRHHS